MTELELRMIADNEQDRAEAERWWNEATDESKLAVWQRIQDMGSDDVLDLVSRFAQLAFSEMMEKQIRSSRVDE